MTSLQVEEALCPEGEVGKESEGYVLEREYRRQISLRRLKNVMLSMVCPTGSYRCRMPVVSMPTAL